MEETKMIVRNENENLMTGNKKNMYCSVIAKTVDDKKALYNALESADVLLNDIVGSVIKIKDVYCEEKQVIDDETGELKNKYRTILFDIDGKTYATGSYGIFNAIKRICAIYGMPTWDEGIEVEIGKQKTKDGKSKLTLILK